MNEKIKNSDDIKKKIIYEKFINANIGGNIIVSDDELHTKYEYSIILTETTDAILDIMLRIRRGESFEKIAKERVSKKFNTDNGGMLVKDVGESLLAIEFTLCKLNEGDVSGFFPLAADNQQQLYGYAVIRLNKKIILSDKDIFNELAKKEFSNDYSSLSPVNKEIIDSKFKKYLEFKEKRLFMIKAAAIKNQVLRQIWDAGYVKILQ